jgi:hypothetical protein
MPVTVIRCSESACGEPATHKIGAPWKAGPCAELKTYGYACNEHVERVMEYAQSRPHPEPGPGETVGAIVSVPLS